METIVLLSMTLSLGTSSYPEREAANQTLWRLKPEAYLVWGAKQLFLYHQLKAGKSRADLVKLLDAMVDYEKNWILKNKSSYTFSPELLEAAGK